MSNNTNYKFSSLKVFGSTEFVYQNHKKYRRVYDESECTFLYAELMFFNKLFDEKNWTTSIVLKCTNFDTSEQLCELKKDVEITSDLNIVYIREGWGTQMSGWWKKGKYRWEAFIDGVFVGETTFYVTNIGAPSNKTNPFFSIKGIRLFESGKEPLPLQDRKYYTQFSSKPTRYINVEMQIEVNSPPSTSNMPIELQFNFINDAGQFKTYMEYFNTLELGSEVFLDTGYGSDAAGYWFEDDYTLEVIFMDTLIAVIPFKVASEFIESDSSSNFFTNFKRANLLKKGEDDDLEFDMEEEDVLTNAANKELSFEEAAAELNGLIGLSVVKKEVKEFSQYLQFLKIRKEKGFDENQKFNLNMVFTGNPGTGKTTVARMLGKIFKSLSLLSNGEVFEVGRNELVGEYIGQTAPKVKKAIEKARGGILLVDEAYSLSDRGDDNKDFGKEVIEILIKEMSDGIGDICIIFAGYPKEMQSFVNSNPGLASRIGRTINFPDYNPDELMEIADYTSTKNGVSFVEEARTFLHRKIVEIYRNRDLHFGNARFMNGIVEEAKQNMALRIMQDTTDFHNLDKEALSTIQLKDFETAFGESVNDGVELPTDEPLLLDALAQLNELIGLDAVKKDVQEMVKLVRYYREIGKNIRNSFSIHTVFTGNPGTGKTTVARILAQIYKSLGILERGHLVETDRRGLVAGYVGQTAIKTGELIDKSIGGCLFIDEAYSLAGGSDNDFGKEAIETLLKRMEDQRGKFMVVVAGYPKEMRRFLESNPGLMSRFDKQLHFEDYSTEDLIRIADSLFDKEGLHMDDDSRVSLAQHLTQMLENKHQYFGNARTVRKIVAEVVRNQNLRLASVANAHRTPAMMKTVILEDIAQLNLLEQKNEPSRKGIGYNNG